MTETEAKQALQQLGRLEEAVVGGDLVLAQKACAYLRTASLELSGLILERQGEFAQRGFLNRLFRLGVFDLPPLTGAPYSAWRILNRKEAPAPESLEYLPLLSILMPVYQPNLAWLDQAAASVLSQSYPKIELCIADDKSVDPMVRQYLEQLQDSDERVKCVFRERNGHISAATNSALELAGGEWSLLLDQDDLLTQNSLAWLVYWLNRFPGTTGVVFSDEDKVDEDDPEDLFSPLFKPGFDPDLLLACNSVSHLGAYRTSLLREIGGLREGYEGAQDHDLCLRLLAVHGADIFRHIPQVLYHWRRHQGSTALHQSSKPYVAPSGLKARLDYARSLRESKPEQAEILFVPRPDSAFMKVSFVPPRPRPELAVLVLLHELFISFSRSEQEAWFKAVSDKLSAYGSCVPLLIDPFGQAGFLQNPAAAHGFDYVQGNGQGVAQLLNTVARQINGKVLIMLRAGDLPLSEEWAANLVGAVWREGVGMAGCRTIDGENFILQAGYALSRSPLPLNSLIPGRTSWAMDSSLWLCPAYAGLHLDSPGYYDFAHLLHSVLAVDFSGLCCKRDLFLDLGGFSQQTGQLEVADFCLRALYQRKLRSLILPDADLRSRHAVGPLRVEGDFAAAWQTRLCRDMPWQGPLLDWTLGGWRLAHPGAEKAFCD